MTKIDDKYLSKCTICKGNGKVNCDCINENNNSKECLICRGEEAFLCPICEGKGKL